MIKIEKEDQCCGCGACSVMCPKHAISMIKDEKGFVYPAVDDALCINCGRCIKVCAFKGAHEDGSTLRGSYALQHRDKDVLKRSSSGGAFTAISDIVIERGGRVYGAAFTEDFLVKHRGASTKKERDQFRESKYVQSEAFHVFEEICQSLMNDQIVLFTGTPCQCDALISYLGTKPDNLIVIDLLCHGVPSNLILQDHIHMWEKRLGKKAVGYHYRSKLYGYEHTHEIEFADGSSDHSIELKRLLKLYALSMRPSCYSCPYASRHRVGDLTIGDLWEAAKAAGIYDHEGTSTIFVNTEKGQQIMEEIKTSTSLKPVDINIDSIQALNRPVSHTVRVDSFWETYLDAGYEKALDKFGAQTLKSTIYQNMLRAIYTLHLDKIYERTKR